MPMNRPLRDFWPIPRRLRRPRQFLILLQHASSISLPAVIDRRAVSGLAVEISDALAKGSHLQLDGSAVQQVGQIGLQLLLSAFKTATSRDARISITQPSAAIMNAAKISGTLDLLGLEPAHAA